MIEPVHADTLDWPQLLPDSFVAVRTCPCCNGTHHTRLDNQPGNMVGGRAFPSGGRKFSCDLRLARHLRRCLTCGVIFQSLVPSERLLCQLYATQNEGTPWRPDPNRLTYSRALANLPAESGKLLDIGANDGHFLSLLPTGWARYALEPVGASRAVLGKVAVEIHEGFLDDPACNLPDNAFDVVTMFDVAEHLRDVRQALGNVVNCLKPGGLLLLETGNVGCLPAKLFGSFWWYYDYIEHTVFFDPRSMQYALNQACMDVISVQRVVHSNRGSMVHMALDLLRALRRWRSLPHSVNVCDATTIWLQHPLRTYWPDHLFVIGQKRKSVPRRGNPM